MMNKNNHKRISMILIGIGVIIMGLIYFNFSQPIKPEEPTRHEISKTGAATTLDFNGEANKINVIVDEVLKKNALSVKDSKELTKERTGQKVEGNIRWHTRQRLINVPSGNIEAVVEIVQKGLQASGAGIITSQPDNYQGQSVLRLDIGFKEKVAGEEITIISDSLYLAKDKSPVSTAVKSEVKGRGQMAIVIDDFGYNKEPIGAFTTINRPLTFAVLPYHPFSNEAASRGLSSGHQVILHLPMEPLAHAEQSEKVTISINMSNSEIQEITQKAIDTIPGLIGVNNHQGSRATADARVMKAVLKQLKSNSLFFLDSRTNGQSIAAETARQMGIKAGENELFIDNSDDVNSIKAKLRAAQDMAIKHGKVTVIGHARMNTATAVSEMIPELEANGIELIFESQIIK